MVCIAELGHVGDVARLLPLVEEFAILVVTRSTGASATHCEELDVILHPLAEDEGKVGVKGQPLPCGAKPEAARCGCIELFACINAESSFIKALCSLIGEFAVCIGHVPHQLTVSRVNTCADRHIVVDRLTYEVCQTFTVFHPFVKAVEQFRNLVGIVGKVTIDVHVQTMPVLYGVHVKLELDTLVDHRTDIHRLGGETCGIGHGDAHQHVDRLAMIVAELNVCTVEDACREAEVSLILCLPSKFAVCRTGKAPALCTTILCGTCHAKMLIVANTRGVTCRAIRGFEFQIIKPPDGPQELLRLDIPHQTAGSKGCGAVVHTEAGAAVVTNGEVGEVFVLETIVYASEEGEVFHLGRGR